MDRLLERIAISLGLIANPDDLKLMQDKIDNLRDTQNKVGISVSVNESTANNADIRLSDKNGWKCDATVLIDEKGNATLRYK